MHEEELYVIRAQLLDTSETPSLSLLIAKSEDQVPIEVEATFDSGFDKVISVPADLADSLGLTFWGFLTDEIGDGPVPQFILAEANVLFAGQEKMVPVVVSAPFGRVVIGARFLERFKTRIVVSNQGAGLGDEVDYDSVEEEQGNDPAEQFGFDPVASPTLPNPAIARPLEAASHKYECQFKPT